MSQRSQSTARDIPTEVDGFELWPNQLEAVERIIDAYDRASNVLVVAPTGSGKTLIGTAIARSVARQALYMPANLKLQDQYHRDFPHVPMAKGHANYPCAGRAARAAPARTPKERRLEQELGDMPDPTLCEDPDCAYRMARAAAYDAEIGNVNPWLHWAIHNSPGQSPPPRSLVVVDEADALEDVFDSLRGARVRLRVLADFQLQAPDDEDDLRAWSAVFEQLRFHMDAAYDARDTSKAEKEKYAKLAGKYERMARDVLDPEFVLTRDEWVARLDSITPAEFARGTFWPHGKRHLLMSATFCDPEAWARRFGIDGFEVVEMASTFPVKNRPIIYDPVMRVLARTFDQPDKVAQLAAAIQQRRFGRTLVHVSSYRQAHALAAAIPGAITHTDSKSFPEALARFRATPDSLLVSPSADRGVDLADDAARTIIVAKLAIGYPDRLTLARRRADPTYERLTLARKLVQQCGRAVRHHDDWATTWILDATLANRQLGRPAYYATPSFFREAATKDASAALKARP